MSEKLATESNPTENKGLHHVEEIDERSDRIAVHDGWIYRSYTACSSNMLFQHSNAVSAMCHVPDPKAPHVLALKSN